MCKTNLLRSLVQSRSLWRTITFIAMLFSLVGSSAGLVKAVGENLLPSDITASPTTLAYGEEVTFTVTLRNTGSADAVAQVTVQMPSELTYVAGSATGGGTPEGNGVSWTDISVPASGSVVLTLKATPTVVVSADKVVYTVAAIMSEHLHFMRFAKVTLVPSSVPPPPGPNLAGSYKTASKHILGPGEELTFTINLHNSGTEDAVVDVTDELPTELNYVPGSATDGGGYDSDAGTISWTDIAVPTTTDKVLSFAVTAKTLDTPQVVVNKATIIVGDASIERQATVLVVPEELPPDHDRVPPVVSDLTIDDQDVLTNREVTLHISASDNVGVTEMYLREWHLATRPIPHWKIVQSSGWVPYQADYDWTLGAESGTHFVGVWVSDGEDNTSWLGGHGLDFASLLLPDESVPRGGMVPYLVYYESGVTVNAVLSPTAGDTDLYVWYPNHFFGPDQKSTNPGTDTDSVSFTTPYRGTYLFLVYGYEASTYNLNITPGGGPRVMGMTGVHADETNQVVSNDQIIALGKVELTSEPVLTWSGLDPMSVTPTWAPRFSVYLPMIVK